ncbi:type II toxin-antitoxin system RelE/ParE family toxin [Pigmentiphaga soli]|uniref:Type II toxin-antitoxin system RelE/ParE family toxin n=1 Tax=Pigmentiphaga soli TaxID=1007095 RepID=A0ABP8GPJ2_9BURK
MIKSFRHKGLQLFFETGSRAKIHAPHADKLRRQLLALNRAARPEDMGVPGWRLHPLKGQDLTGHWAVWINGNWRLAFRFEGEDARLVDYQDYH